MTLAHGSGAKQALADALDDYVNTGGAGVLKIYDSAANLLVSITLNNPAFNTVGDSAVLDGTPSGTAVATGDVDNFELENGAGNTVYTGSVTASGGGGDLEIDGSAEITSGEIVTISSHRWAIT